jgi:hypothetical protein
MRNATLSYSARFGSIQFGRMKMARVGEQAFRIARCSGVLYGFCGYSENGLASVEASAAQNG